MKSPGHKPNETKAQPKAAAAGLDLGASSLMAHEQDASATSVAGGVAALPTVADAEVLDLLSGDGDVPVVAPAAFQRRSRELTPRSEGPANSPRIPVAPSDWRADAFRATRALAEAGIEPSAGVKVVKVDPTWGWEPLCPEETALSHLTTGPVSQKDLQRICGLKDAEFQAALSGLEAKSLIRIHRGQTFATATGVGVVNGRLADLERDNAVAVGAGQIFGSALALESGSMSAKDFTQNIASVVHRGQDLERKIALLHVASVASEEALGRLESGVDAPKHLGDLASYLRFSLPSEARPIAEPSLQRMRAVQAVANHWERLDNVKAQGEQALRTFVGLTDSYQEVFRESGASRAAMQHASMLSLRSLQDVGDATPADAGRIAKAVLGAFGQTEAPNHIDLGQALEVLSPTVAVKAVLAQPGEESFAKGLQSSKQEAIAMADLITRPILSGVRYDADAALKRLTTFIEQLGHDLNERDMENLKDSVRSVKAADEAAHAHFKPLVDAQNEDEVRDALRSMAESLAEAECAAGATERFQATVRVMAMIASGADVEDLERAHHAATIIADHPLVDPEERIEAGNLAATTKTILVAVAGVLPAKEDREALLKAASFEATGPNEVVAFLRASLVPGQGTVRPNMPWPATMADANLIAYKEMARLGELHAVMSLDAISTSWTRRVIRDRMEGKPDAEIQDDGFLMPSGPEAKQGKALTRFIQKLNEHDTLNPYGVFVVVQALGITFGKPMPDEDQIPDAVEFARVAGAAGGSCKILRLGLTDPTLVNAIKVSMLEHKVAFTVLEFTEDELADQFARAQDKVD